jgi:hypothetical protein
MRSKPLPGGASVSGIDSTKTDTLDEGIKRLDRLKKLTSFLENKVQLDTLLDHITHQERVKLICKLNVHDNYCSGGGNHFEIEYEPDTPEPDVMSAKAILVDGDNKIPFKKYKVLCPVDSNCNEYGFNMSNSFETADIIEVCGRRYLYAKLVLACNGIGCGCNLIMIYDIEKKRPTFIENYRINYKGYYISDFDGDSIPDLLVMDQESGFMKGLNAETTTLSLYDYKYQDGTFSSKSYLYKLLGLTEYVYYPDIYSLLDKAYGVK